MKYLKAILIILGVMIAVALIYFLIKPDTEKISKSQETSDISRQYEEYSKQIRNLKNQIAQKERELQGEETGWVILAFSADDPELMDTVFDSVQECGLTATVVVNPRNLPVDEGDGLSLEDVKKLKENGWDIALGGELDNEMPYEELIAMASSDLQKNGLGIPKAIFFNEGDYQKGKTDLFPVMEKMGFEIGVAFGENDNGDLISTKLEDYPSIYVCQNISMRTGLTTSKQMIANAYHDKKPLVLSDYSRNNTWETRTSGTISELERILNVVEKMNEEGKIQAGSVSSYLEYQDMLNEDVEERQESYETLKKECEEQIAELEILRRNLGAE